MNSTLGTAQFEKKLWRQRIVLLQSTRADVEKLFGKPSLGHDYLISYKFNEGMWNIIRLITARLTMARLLF